MSFQEKPPVSEPAFHSPTLSAAFKTANESFQRFSCDLDSISADIRTLEADLQARRIGIPFEMEIGVFFDWSTKKQVEDYDALVIGEVEYLLWAKIRNEFRLCYKKSHAPFLVSLLHPDESNSRQGPEEPVEIKPLIDTKSDVRKRLYDSLAGFVVALGNMAARKNLDFSEYDSPSGNHLKAIQGYEVGRVLSPNELFQDA